MLHMDDAGEQVARFMGDVVNFTRIGELVDETLAMARSQAWRRYVTGIGPAEWRQSEFDYFLIACGVPYEDAARVLAWGKAGAEIGAMMKPDAEKRSRRSLEDAGRAYQGAGPESLEARAGRLGWIARTGGMKKPPISSRALSIVNDAKDLETKAAETRANNMTATRRRQLDRLAKTIIADVPASAERRYLIDQIRPVITKGRPTSTKAEWAQWRADAKAHDYNAVALAKFWDISRMQTSRRLKEVRAIS
jgi:hypothetical protein